MARKSVVGCMVAPPKDTSMSSFLGTVNVPLFGKRGLCRCNQVNDLERRRYSWIIQVSPNCKDKCPCQKEVGGDLRKRRSRGQVTTRQGGSGMATSSGPPGAPHTQLKEAGAGPPLKALQEHCPDDTFILDSRLPEP